MSTAVQPTEPRPDETPQPRPGWHSDPEVSGGLHSDNVEAIVPGE